MLVALAALGGLWGCSTTPPNSGLQGMSAAQKQQDDAKRIQSIQNDPNMPPQAKMAAIGAIQSHATSQSQGK